MDILRGLPSAFVQCVLQEFPSIWAQLHFYEQELRGAGSYLLGRMELLRSLLGYLHGACWRTSSLSTGLFKWELYCLFFLSSRIPRQKWSSHFCPQTSWSAIAWLAGFTAPYYFRVLLRFNFFLFWLLFVSSTVLVLWSCSRALQLHSVLLYGVHHTEPEGLHAYGCTILNLPLPSSEALSGGGHSWVGAVLWAGGELVLKWVVLWPSELPSRQIRVLQVVSVSDVSFPWGQWLSTCVVGLAVLVQMRALVWTLFQAVTWPSGSIASQVAAVRKVSVRSEAGAQHCAALPFAMGFLLQNMQASRRRGISISTQRVFSFCHINNLFYFALGL